MKNSVSSNKCGSVISILLIKVNFVKIRNENRKQNDLRFNCNFFQPHWSRMVRVFFTLANQMEAFFQCFFPTSHWRLNKVRLSYFLSVYLSLHSFCKFLLFSVLLFSICCIYIRTCSFCPFFFFCCSQFPYIITTFVT